MTHRYIKLAATSVVLVLAFSGLLWSTLREGAEYYKNVDEVMTNREAWEGKKLQLHGYVVPGSILRKRDSLEYRFKVRNTPARAGGDAVIVDAAYSGVVPDTFKDEAEVVLKGRLDGVLFHTEPNGVMAKCPSKYEAAEASLLDAPGT
jgi:cytochrome c-type biogenesis protein CcmE